MDGTMKVVCCIAAIVVIGTSACGKSCAWSWRIGNAYFGAAGDALDDYDSSDRLLNMPRPYYVATYHTPGSAGWSGDEGYYWMDTRSQLALVPGESKTWTFYMWADSTSGGTNLQLAWLWDQARRISITSISC